MRLRKLSLLALYAVNAGALPVLWRLKDPPSSSASLQKRDEPFGAEAPLDLHVQEPRLLPRRPEPVSLPPSSGPRRASSSPPKPADHPSGDAGRLALQARSEIPAQEKPSDQNSAPNLPFDLLQGTGKPSFLGSAPAASSSRATPPPFTIGGPFGSRSPDSLLPKSNALDDINPSLDPPDKENGLFPSNGLVNLQPPSLGNQPSSNGKTPDLLQPFSLPGLGKVPGSASNPLSKPSPPPKPSPLPKAGPVPIPGASLNADLPPNTPPQERTGNSPQAPPLADDEELEEPEFTDLPPMEGEFTLPYFPNANFERLRDPEDQITPGQPGKQNQPPLAEDPSLDEPRSTTPTDETWQEYDQAMQEYNDEMEKYWAARDKMTGKSPMPRPQIPQLPKLPEMPALPESPPLSESPELPELNTQYPDPSAWSSPGSQESRIPPINPYAARRPYSTDRNPPAAPGTQSSLGNDRYRTGPDEAETAAESQASFLESCYPTGNIGGSRSWDVNDTPDCKMYDFNLYMDKHQISFKSCSRANICYIKCPMNVWGIQRCTDHCAKHFQCKPVASGISPSRGIL